MRVCGSVGSCSRGLLSAGDRPRRRAQTVQLPQITVNAPSPISRAPRRRPTPSARTLQGTLPIVTDQFAHRDRGAGAKSCSAAPARRSAMCCSPSPASPVELRARRREPADHPRPRHLSRPHPGERLGGDDVSDLGEDHVVPVDPLAAQQIEVIRGPATLRYGSQAIGGVVNVDNNRIPTSIPLRGFAGESQRRAATASTTAARARCCSTPARAISRSTPMPSAAAPTTTASRLSLSVSARSARRWSATGSRTRRCAPTASRSAAPTFSTAALSASRCRGSPASIASPASRRRRPARASTSTRPR